MGQWELILSQKGLFWNSEETLCTINKNYGSELGVLAHAYLEALGRLKQEDLEFRASLGHAGRFCAKANKCICDRSKGSLANREWHLSVSAPSSTTRAGLFFGDCVP